MAHPTSAYIHVPFCAHRCGYCNFTLVAGRDDLIDRYLEALERDHTAAQIAASVERLRPPVRSMSLDLIFGTPGETFDSWRQDLETALRLAPDHVSTYGLTFERGTSFWSRREHGALQSID